MTHRPPRRIAIVVGDSSEDGVAIALELAVALRSPGATTELWGRTRDPRFRRGCRQADVASHTVPPAMMDGSLASRRYFTRLRSGLARARPDLIIGLGMPAGVACGLMWRSVGASRCIWYQADARPVPVDPRALRLAAGWTPHLWAANEECARLMTGTLGVRADAVETLSFAGDRILGIVARVAALDQATAPLSGMAAGFEPRLVVQVLFQHIIEQEEHAGALARHLLQSGVGRVFVYGYNMRAQVLISACRRRRVRVTGLAPLLDTPSDTNTDARAIPRMTLAKALTRGAGVVAIASRQSAVEVARHVRHVARVCGVTVRIVAAGHPGFVVRARASNGRRVARGLHVRHQREISRHARPIVAALCRKGVRTCCIYGASDVGRAILRLARRRRIDVPFFVDSDPAKWGEVVDGVHVASLAQAVAAGTRVFAIGSIRNAGVISATVASAYPAAMAPDVYEGRPHPR